MEIEVKRVAKKEKYTIGRLYVDGVKVCDVIEDKDRQLTSKMPLQEIIKKKVTHQTAIPTGRYKVTLGIKSPTFSKKAYYKNFCNGYLPRLLDVPGFDGILIHRGTDQDSSSGCLIVGYNTVVGKVTNSQEAFEKLYKLLKSAKDQIYITIK